MASIMMNQRVDFNNPVTTKPANLANSAVLRMLEEEEQRQRSGQQGKYSRGRQDYDPQIRRLDRMIDWPPQSKNNEINGYLNMNNTYSSRFFAPIAKDLKRVAWPPPPEENEQDQQEAPVRQAPPVKLQQSPAFSRLIPIEQEFEPPQSKVYSPQPQLEQKPIIVPITVQKKPISPQPIAVSRSPLSPQASTPTQIFPPPLPENLQQNFYKPSQPSAFAHTLPKKFSPVSAQFNSSEPVNAFTPPIQDNTPSQSFAPVSSQRYSPVNPPTATLPASNSPRGWAPVSSPTPLVAPAQNQFVEPPPSTVILRPAAPIHLPPPPVVSSQPATNSFAGGVNMRGDQKWPPQNVKEAVAAENEARVLLARGPACRPRKVKRDYGDFFAKNALPHNYPGYRAPPGTQHFDDQSGKSSF